MKLQMNRHLLSWEQQEPPFHLQLHSVGVLHGQVAVSRCANFLGSVVLGVLGSLIRGLIVGGLPVEGAR